MGCRDAVASGLHWKPFARMMAACIRLGSSLADFWSSGSTRCKDCFDPSQRETEWKAGPEPSDPALACLCKASPSRPGRLLSCLLVDIPQPFMFKSSRWWCCWRGVMARSPYRPWRSSELSRAARAAPRTQLTEFAGKPYPRSSIFSALFHSFCSYGFSTLFQCLFLCVQAS